MLFLRIKPCRQPCREPRRFVSGSQTLTSFNSCFKARNRSAAPQRKSRPTYPQWGTSQPRNGFTPRQRWQTRVYREGRLQGEKKKKKTEKEETNARRFDFDGFFYLPRLKGGRFASNAVNRPTVRPLFLLEKKKKQFEEFRGKDHDFSLRAGFGTVFGYLSSWLIFENPKDEGIDFFELNNVKIQKLFQRNIGNWSLTNGTRRVWQSLKHLWNILPIEKGRKKKKKKKKQKKSSAWLLIAFSSFRCRSENYLKKRSPAYLLHRPPSIPSGGGVLRLCAIAVPSGSRSRTMDRYDRGGQVSWEYLLFFAGCYNRRQR